MTGYNHMTTATMPGSMTATPAPAQPRKPTMTQQRAKYRGMTPEQMARSMSNKELAANAGRGGIAAIEEQKRRQAPTPPASKRGTVELNAWYVEHAGMFRTQAEILGERHRYADRVLPDPELDLGV